MLKLYQFIVWATGTKTEFWTCLVWNNNWCCNSTGNNLNGGDFFVTVSGQHLTIFPGCFFYLFDVFSISVDGESIVYHDHACAECIFQHRIKTWFILCVAAIFLYWQQSNWHRALWKYCCNAEYNSGLMVMLFSTV